MDLGGHLELNKTIYNLLIWSFNDYGVPTLKTEQKLPENMVQVIEATGVRVKLQQSDVNTARRMLGVKQAATMNMDSESTPRAIVFASHKFSGIGLLHPKCEQAPAKINCVIKHIRADTSVGLSIANALGWAQVCAGTSMHILRDT
eukprot:3930092-Ditylum_brightwellii.AAC.1